MSLIIGNGVYINNGAAKGSAIIKATVEGVAPLTLQKALAKPVASLKVFGGTEQNGTPTPDAPVDIVCNNGVLKARHQSSLPLGYTLLEYIESTGTQYIDTGLTADSNTRVLARYKLKNTNFLSPIGVRDVVSVGAGYCVGVNGSQQFISDYNGSREVFTTITPNTTDIIIVDKNKNVCTITIGGQSETVINTASTFTTTNTLTFFAQNSAGTVSSGYYTFYSFKMWNNDVLVRDFIPAKNSSNVVGMYDLVSGQFFTNSGTGTFTAGNAIDDIEIYTDGTVETIEVDTTGDTATAEMLLKVGNYQDVQSIIDGVVTRKVGVKVFDGTEDWTYSEPNTYGIANITGTIAGKVDGNTILFICSHFVPQTTAWSSTQTEGVLNGNNNNQVFFRVLGTRISSLAAWQQYLADQYAAGTPVIIVYPLATETTESVTPQVLETAKGDNIADITQASLTGLELEVTYRKKK